MLRVEGIASRIECKEKGRVSLCPECGKALKAHSERPQGGKACIRLLVLEDDVPAQRLESCTAFRAKGELTERG